MLTNSNGGEGKDNKDSQQLIKLIKDTCFEQFYELAAKEGIECQQPVIVKTVASDGGSATIAFPSDPTYATKIYFTNCTGSKLVSGQKVYLHHNFDNPSQGWLVSNQNNYKIGGITNVLSGYQVSATVRQVGNLVSVFMLIFNNTKIGSGSLKLCTITGVDFPYGGVQIGAYPSTASAAMYGYIRGTYHASLGEGDAGDVVLTVDNPTSVTFYAASANFSYII